MMDDGEVESPSGGGFLDLHADPYSDFLDDWDPLIGTQICSHKHICNPTTGPDNTHTHTCEHTHTHTIGSGDDEKLTKKRRPSGNKEAVRKYREKQKAVKVNLEVRNAELEKENQRIPELYKENVRLRKKLQEQGPRQDAVEHLLTENKRLRGLLSQLRRAIDSELECLEDVSYQNLLFTPSKVGRGGGKLLPPGARCAAPVRCFPARPVAHRHSEGSTDDLEHTEGSLGWHTECELGKKVTPCHNPEEFEDADVGTADECAGLGAEVTTPSSNTGISSLGSKRRLTMCLSKSAIAASRQNNGPAQTVAAAPAGSVTYEQESPSEIRCPVASLPLPCFSNGPKVPAAHLPGGARQPEQVENFQEDCDLVDGDAEMTVDSTPLPSASLSPPEDMTQSASTPLCEEPFVTPSLKKGRMETDSSADLFFPECFYSDGVTQGPAAARWNHQLLPNNISDSWLEECDIIDGVCQAHLEYAIQNSGLGSPEEAGYDMSRSAAVAVPTICNQ